MDKSESIKELASALAKFQGEVKNTANSKTVIVKTKSGSTYTYKYSPLDEVLSMVRPILSTNGLSMVQSPSNDNGTITLTTVLMHSSGEWLEFPPLQLKAEANTPQGVGSAITYARRYVLSAVLGISSEDDNDANVNEHNISSSEPKQAAKTKSSLSEAQIKRLYAIAKAAEVTQEQVNLSIQTEYKKENANELTKKEYDELCNRLEKAKK